MCFFFKTGISLRDEKFLKKKKSNLIADVYRFGSLLDRQNFWSALAMDNSSRNLYSFELYSQSGCKFLNRKPWRVHVHKKFSYATAIVTLLSAGAVSIAQLCDFLFTQSMFTVDHSFLGPSARTNHSPRKCYWNARRILSLETRTSTIRKFCSF